MRYWLRRIVWMILQLVTMWALPIYKQASKFGITPQWCFWWWRYFHRSCVENCEKSGCIEDSCFNSCKFPVDSDPDGVDQSSTMSLDPTYETFLKEPLYLRWKKWDCTSECRYQCMVQEEMKRESAAQLPVKYHGKWPFIRIFSLQVFPFVHASG